MTEDYDLENLMERLEAQLAAGEDIEQLLAEASAHGISVQIGDETSAVDMDPVEITVTPEEMAAFDSYKLTASEMVRLRLAEIKITSLAESQAITAAISQVTNQAQFASEFEATPNYKKAVADAFLGSWESMAQKAAKSSLGAMGLPNVAKPIITFICALQKEQSRALAAAADKSVKDFLNHSLTGVVKQMSRTLSDLGKDADLTTACVDAAHEAAMGFWMDDQESGRQQRDSRLVEFCDQLQDAISASMNIGQMDISSKHKVALKGLIEGVTSNGYIEWGVVCHDTEVWENDENKIAFRLKSDEPAFWAGAVPTLKGTANNKRFATALNDYLREFGETLNDLDIEKRVDYRLKLEGLGIFSDFRGYIMDSHVRWTTSTPTSINPDGKDLIDYYNGQIPAVFFTYTLKYFLVATRYLDSSTVTA